MKYSKYIGTKFKAYGNIHTITSIDDDVFRLNHTGSCTVTSSFEGHVSSGTFVIIPNSKTTDYEIY